MWGECASSFLPSLPQRHATHNSSYLYRIIDITYTPRTLRESNNNIAEPSRRRRRRRFLVVKVTGSDDGRDVRWQNAKIQPRTVYTAFAFCVSSAILLRQQAIRRIFYILCHMRRPGGGDLANTEYTTIILYTPAPPPPTPPISWPLHHQCLVRRRPVDRKNIQILARYIIPVH